jgi:hypothetical protein
VVRNSYILFDANFTGPENLRKFLFTHEDTEENVFRILEWIEKMSMEKVNTNTGNHEEIEKQAAYFVRKIRSGIPAGVIAEEMGRTNFLGQHSISCPCGTGQAGSFSETLARNSEQIEYWHPGTCKNCGSITNVGPCSICKACEKIL